MVVPIRVRAGSIMLWRSSLLHGVVSKRSTTRLAPRCQIYSHACARYTSYWGEDTLVVLQAPNLCPSVRKHLYIAYTPRWVSALDTNTPQQSPYVLYGADCRMLVVRRRSAQAQPWRSTR